MSLLQTVVSVLHCNRFQMVLETPKDSEHQKKSVSLGDRTWSWYLGFIEWWKIYTWIFKFIYQKHKKQKQIEVFFKQKDVSPTPRTLISNGARSLTNTLSHHLKPASKRSHISPYSPTHLFAETNTKQKNEIKCLLHSTQCSISIIL